MDNFDVLIVNDYNKIVKGFSYEIFSLATIRQNQPTFHSINTLWDESSGGERGGTMIVC
jgi:hypothetical protein